LPQPPPLLLFFFFFSCSAHPRPLHSFPTRRSSDLLIWPTRVLLIFARATSGRRGTAFGSRPRSMPPIPSRARISKSSSTPRPRRSEEHTSELQSRENLVCRLLLEKKKKKNITKISH